MPDYSVEYYVTKAADREVPGHLIHSLAQYIYNGRPTGGFLEAVLQSDLFDAFRRGDEESLRGLRNLVMFLYNDAPIGCWFHGSSARCRRICPNLRRKLKSPLLASVWTSA